MGYRSNLDLDSFPDISRAAADAWIRLPMDFAISAADFAAIFSLGEALYIDAVKHHAISYSYRSPEAPETPRLVHDLTDAFYFAAVLSLGWPLRSIEDVADEAFDICDRLCGAWEDCMNSPVAKDADRNVWPEPMLRDERLILRELVMTALSMTNLSAERREALVRHLVSIMSRLRTIVLKPGGSIRGAIPAE